MNLRRSRRSRLAILLIALSQVIAPLLPHAGSVSGVNAERPHWHAAGDRLELSHNETACPACSLQQTARLTTQTLPVPLGAITPIRFGSATQPLLQQVATTSTHSRAPPALG